VGVDSINVQLSFAAPCISVRFIKITNMDMNDLLLASRYNLIKQSKSLTSVDLGYNQIGAVGASAIAEAIKQSQSLTTVTLSGNSIGGEGASAIAEAIKQSKSLTTVNLSGNSIGVVGAAAIAEAIKQSKSLIQCNCSQTD